jgi:hypothetical protein
LYFGVVSAGALGAGIDLGKFTDVSARTKGLVARTLDHHGLDAGRIGNGLHMRQQQVPHHLVHGIAHLGAVDQQPRQRSIKGQ